MERKILIEIEEPEFMGLVNPKERRTERSCDIAKDAALHSHSIV
jgi:hypothetical protein